MEKRLMTLLMGLFLCIGGALAQTKVNGTVVSQDDGEPVIGASILVVGTNVGTVTNTDGQFSLTVPAGKKTLRVTYVGMLPQEVIARPSMRIALATDTKALDEVIVVAYGTQKKSSFTGAAATMKADKIQNQQVSNLSKALEGQIAGVQISSNSGQPGSAANIIVRGIGSISSSQSPLIIVDGVPYEGSLNSISPQDIESMTVLKDAAANSMYGARGANGVIMITTKGAKGGKAKVTLDAKWGFNARAVDNYDIITDPAEYYEMYYEAYRNSLVSTMGMAQASNYAAQHLIDGTQGLGYNVYKDVADDQLIDPLTGKINPNATTRKWSDDWTKDPFKNGMRQEYNVNISGGNDNTKAYVSLGYLGDEGYIAGSDFDRYTGRVKVDQNIGQYIKVGGNIAYARTDQHNFNSSVTSNYSNIFMFSQSIAPIYPIYSYDAQGNQIYNEDGSVKYDFGTENNRPYASEQNPLAVAKENYFQTLKDNVSSRGYFEATFLKDFKFTANIAYDVFNNNETRFNTPIGGDAQNVGGRGYKYATRYGALNTNQILDWNHEFGKHGVHLMAVHENKKDNYNYLYGQMTNYSDYSNPEFSNAALYQELNSYTYEYALEGYLFKGEYNYADKYYMTASFRRDGSSRFYKDNRWGTFWAIGGAWRIDQEDFLKNIKAISALKLKASYGTQGNDNILDPDGYTIPHAYEDQYTVNRLAGGNAAFTKTLRGNKDLTWEKQSMFNVGFELGLLSRINVNFDFFIKNNKDMLFQSPLARSEGNPSWIYRNEVDMKNTGFEVEVNADVIKNHDLKWNVSLNFSHYKNELTKLPESKPDADYPDGFQRGSYWWKKGGSLYNWSGYEYVGVDEATGKPQYNKYIYKTAPGGEQLREGYTTDENGNITANGTGQVVNIVDHVEIVNTSSEATIVDLNKSAIPDLVGGFATTVEYRGFDLNIQTAFQLGGYVLDTQYAQLMNAGGRGENFHKDMFNRWTPANTKTDIPALNIAGQENGIASTSDFFLTKANYFSLKNVTLGYTLPKSLTAKIGIEKLRVYATGDNIWLLSKRKGLDPRMSFSGSNSYFRYSALSSYSLGINVEF